MAHGDVTVIPLGAGASVSEYLAEIHRRLDRQERVRFRMGPMGTALEGSVADIVAVFAELHAVPFELGIPRVYSILKLDERRDRAQGLDDKVRAVEVRLAEDA